MNAGWKKRGPGDQFSKVKVARRPIVYEGEEPRGGRKILTYIGHEYEGS